MKTVTSKQIAQITDLGAVIEMKLSCGTTSGFVYPAGVPQSTPADVLVSLANPAETGIYLVSALNEYGDIALEEIKSLLA